MSTEVQKLDLALKGFRKEADVILSLREKNQFAVFAQHLSTARCKQKIPTTQELEDYFENYTTHRTPHLQPLSKSGYGIPFENQDRRLLNAFKQSYYPNGGDIRNVPTQMRKCKTVVCAMTAAYGKDAGLRLLFLAERFKAIAAQEVFVGNRKEYSSQELDSIIQAFADLPSFFFTRQTLPIYLLRRTESAGSTIASYQGFKGSDPYILTHPQWYLLSADERTATFSHEIGHHMGNTIGSVDGSKTWLAMHKTSLVAPEETASSLYALTNSDEDFAETFTAYRYRPEWLKQRNLEKYNLLRDAVFLGIEYTENEVECRDTPLYYDQISRRIQELSIDWEKMSPAITLRAPELFSVFGNNYSDEKTNLFLENTLRSVQSSIAVDEAAHMTSQPALFKRAFSDLKFDQDIKSKVTMSPDTFEELKLKTFNKVFNTLVDAVLSHDEKATTTKLDYPKDIKEFCEYWKTDFQWSVPLDNNTRRSQYSALEAYGERICSVAYTYSRGGTLTREAVEFAVLNSLPKSELHQTLMHEQFKQIIRKELLAPTDVTRVVLPRRLLK